jgi:hypothetical protein
VKNYFSRLLSFVRDKVVRLQVLVVTQIDLRWQGEEQAERVTDMKQTQEELKWVLDYETIVHNGD